MSGEAKRLLEQATPLPWYLHREWNGEPSSPFLMDSDDPQADHPRLLVTIDSDAQYGDADADLILYAVNRLPASLELEEALERLVDAYGYRLIVPQVIVDARTALARLHESEAANVG